MNIFWFLKPKITYSSKINGTITIGVLQKNKALFSGGVTQSGGEIKPMWDVVINDLYGRYQQSKPKKILILGVAGGSVIQAIRNHDKKADILGIELDPVMKQVAQEQFNIQETAKQHIIIADAIKYISTTKNHTYDLIIVDLYIGSLNPAKSRTKKFLVELKTLLTPKGVILYNAHYQKENTEEYIGFRKLTDVVFAKVTEVYAYPLNRVLRMEN